MERHGNGFTLLELLVVIIIIGILATIGFVQYTTSIEKGRQSEARTNLATLRQLEMAYFNDPQSATPGNYGTLAQVDNSLPAACNANYYFSYACTGGAGPAGACAGGAGCCEATRCTAGGKAPQGTAAYVVALDQAGNLTCPGGGC